MNRRNFLQQTGAGAAVVWGAPLAWGASNDRKITLGLIGCGGRGAWIAKLFADSGKYQLAACADYFPDRVEAIGQQFGIDPSRRFTGLRGHQQLLSTNVEAVVIETPPYFHPEQTLAAVTAGKHVFLAKPIAVDAAGCRTIAEAGELATKKNLVCLVDFQTRASEHYREALRRVHAGEIGSLVLVEAHYPWRGGSRQAPPASPQDRLRHWYNVAALSGDFIVEQSIHALDVATWIINQDPLRAVGTGGQKLRARGSIWDHFAVHYWFPNDLVLAFTCIQTVPEVKDEIRARAYGSDGYLDTDYFSSVVMRGKDVYQGKEDNLYTTGAQANIAEFHRAILAGDASNPTVAPSVRSNLTAILGREAGYRGGEVTWAQLAQDTRRLDPGLTGL